MPQISPMNWLFILLLLTTLISIVLNNFLPHIKSSTTKTSIKQKQKNMKW